MPRGLYYNLGISSTPKLEQELNKKEEDWLKFKLEKEELLHNINTKKEILVETTKNDIEGKYIKKEWLEIVKVHRNVVVAINGQFKEAYTFSEILATR